MSTYKRLPTQKARPSKNQFATRLDHLYHWVETNWRSVIAGIGALAVLVTATLLISHYLGTRDDTAKVLYYKAQKAPAGSEEAIIAFEAVIKEDASSGAAQAARLKLADIYYSRANYEKAEDVLAPLSKNGKTLFRALALENLAAVKLAKGDKKGAAEMYVKAYEDKKNPARGMSYFNAGLSYKEAGDTAEAKKIFEALAKEDADFSNPDLREKSKEQLIWMATK